MVKLCLGWRSFMDNLKAYNFIYWRELKFQIMSVYVVVCVHASIVPAPYNNLKGIL